MKKMLLAAIATISAIAATATPVTYLTKAPADAPATGEFRYKGSMSECMKSLSPTNDSSDKIIRKAGAPVISSDLEPIFETPAGKEEMYSKLTYGCYIFEGMYHAFGKQVGTASRIVYGDDGYVYIKNPFSGWPTFSYLKCERDGDRITARLPQPMFYEQDMYDPSITHTYFATLLYKYDDGTGNVTYIVGDQENTEPQSVSWIIDGESLYLDMGYDPTPDAEGNLTFPDVLFGLADERGTWTIAGDCYQDYTRVDYKTVTVPEGLDVEEWTIVSKESGRGINVAFDGNDIYMSNLSDYLPYSWVKGTIADGKVTFDSFQYIGELELFYNFFIAATYEGNNYQMMDKIELDYDAENRIMTSQAGECIMTNAGRDAVSYVSIFYDPTIKVRNANPNPVPRAPMPTNYADYFDYYGFNYFEFDLSNINLENDLLDTSNMYYQLYFDDMLYTFYPDEHYVAEEMSDVPYNFSNGIDLFADGISHAVYFYFSGFDTIGVKSLNVVDGETYESPMTVYDVATGEITVGVKEVTANAVCTEAEYYNLQGMRVANPENGIFLKVEKYSDGSSRTTKTLKR